MTRVTDPGEVDVTSVPPMVEVRSLIWLEPSTHGQGHIRHYGTTFSLVISGKILYIVTPQTTKNSKVVSLSSRRKKNRSTDIPTRIQFT